jgi:ankyrin repeat protein
MRSILSYKSTEALHVKPPSARANRVQFENHALWFSAAVDNDLCLLGTLLSKNPSLLNDALDSRKVTALHLACSEGKIEAVRFLVEKGANINAKDWQEWTPFHYAAEGLHLPLVRYLLTIKQLDIYATTLDDEAAIDVVDEDGETGVLFKSQLKSMHIYYLQNSLLSLTNYFYTDMIEEHQSSQKTVIGDARPSLSSVSSDQAASRNSSRQFCENRPAVVDQIEECPEVDQQDGYPNVLSCNDDPTGIILGVYLAR